MRRREVAALLAVSESTVKRMVRRGELSQPVVITKGRIGFVRAEVEACLRKLVRTRNGEPSPTRGRQVQP